MFFKWCGDDDGILLEAEDEVIVFGAGAVFDLLMEGHVVVVGGPRVKLPAFAAQPLEAPGDGVSRAVEFRGDFCDGDKDAGADGDDAGEPEVFDFLRGPFADGVIWSSHYFRLE